jgi:hypothetical protein
MEDACICVAELQIDGTFNLYLQLIGAC